jgi:hypothetical protein
MKVLRTWLLLLALGMSAAGEGALLFLTGCEGLDYSARAEGTGVQIIGAVIVLARYRASPQQKAVAEQHVRTALVQAAKPAYEKRRASLHAASRTRIAATQREYDKRISAVSKAQPAIPAADTSAEVRRLQQEREEALAKLQADAAGELESVDTAWRTIGAADYSMKIDASTSGPAGAVPAASTRDEEALLASANAQLPRYLAVPVPPQGIAAEQGAKATVMLWDTRRHRLASEDVLVLDRQVSPGVALKVDGLTARVVTD